MLKIRMQRTGRINMPSFRIVVVEHTASPTAGKFVDKVGTYNPKSKERKLEVERIKHWLSVGAQPSATVHNMLVSLGIINAKKINVLPSFAKATGGKAGQEEAKDTPTAEAAPAEKATKEEPAAPAETPAV